MNKFGNVLITGLVLLPLNAMGETYKCRAPDGKITYAGQMSLTPGVKCEQMFVKKQPVVTQEAQPTPPTTADTLPPNPNDQPPGLEAAKEPETAPQNKDAKKPEVKGKKTEPDESRKKSEKDAADKLAEQKIKQENCQNAQTNLKTYQIGGRISKINDKGEKDYLDDAEIKQKTEQAQKDVEKWCGA